MPWVSRDGATNITGLFAAQQPGLAEEFLPEDDALVVAYRNTPPADPVDRWDLVSLKVALNHENRIRVLEGKGTISMAQLKAALKALPAI